MLIGVRRNNVTKRLTLPDIHGILYIEGEGEQVMGERTTAMNSVLEDIARNVLSLDTMEERGRDSADFAEHAVWSIKEALQEAFRAGERSAQEHAK